MATVTFRFGNQSAYDALKGTGYDSNSLYFIEDTQRLYKGEKLMSEQAIFTDSVPDFSNAVEDRIYVVKNGDDVSFYVKGESSLVQAGGGKVAEGAITDVRAFSDSVLAKSTDRDLADTDTKIPTEGAVKNYVDGVETKLTEAVKATLVDKIIVDVKTGESSAQEETKIGLHFTVKKKNADGTAYEDSEEIVIDLDKEKFLQSAKLSEDGKTLTLEMTNGDKFTIDLAQLVADATTVKTKEEIEVQLGDNGTLGGYKTGDTITAGTSVEQVIKKLLAKQVPPTYTKPTLVVANNSGTGSGNVEYGTTINPKIRATFTKNDAGNLTSIQFKKDGTNVGDASFSTPADYTEEEGFKLSKAVTYTAVATYEEGTIKDDNLGEPYPEGHITAGNVTSNNFTFTPYYPYFYGTKTTKDDAIDGTLVRSLTKSTSGGSNGTKFAITIPVNTLRVVFAYPDTLQAVKDVTSVEQFNSSIKDSFVLSTVQVNDAAGENPKAYKVYVKDLAKPQENATTYNVTI